MKTLIQDSLRVLYRKNIAEPQNSIKIIKQQSFSSDLNSSTSLLSKINKFKFYVKLRSYHYPLQYFCKKWPFRQLELKLKQPILIPRFQSQYMIQILIKRIKQIYTEQQLKQVKFVEYGIGSGALGLSIIKQLNILGTLIDINPQCTALTQINCKLNKIPTNMTQIITADMCNTLDIIKSHQIIISNPPYLSQKHYHKYLKPQIKRYQDKNALVTKNDGMYFIEVLTNQWKNKIMQSNYNKQVKMNKSMMMLEFDGRILEGKYSWLQEFVILDQYGKRRFILLENYKQNKQT